MIVTIHQPEHFPYEGFFQKMKKSDLFVLLDNVKFRKNYFQNRNKIINKNGKEEWFGVAVPKKSSSLLINQVSTVEDKINNWRQKTVKKLDYNLGIDMSKVYNHDKLLDINVSSIEWCRQQLDIKTPMIYASSLLATGSKSELLFQICKELNAKTYLSGPSGKDYLDEQVFRSAGIKIDYFQPEVENYMSMIYNILSKDKK